MSENITSNNMHNNDSNQDNEETDYKNLIARLKEIKISIALLEKIVFR